MYVYLYVCLLDMFYWTVVYVVLYQKPTIVNPNKIKKRKKEREKCRFIGYIQQYV